MDTHMITKLERTCSGFPSQWEGQLDNDEYIYIRYRYGKFSIGTGKTLEEAVWNENGYLKYIGDPYDGIMSNMEMISNTLDSTLFCFDMNIMNLLEEQDELDEFDISEEDFQEFINTLRGLKKAKYKNED